MKDSPFIYGTTVSTHAFTNRDAEIKKLTSNLIHGINTTIISPRRWGKSSLVEKVVRQIQSKHKNIRIVVMDLFSVGTEEEFLELFAKEVIKASSSKWEDWMATGKQFFKQLTPKLSVGVDPNSDFSVSFDWKDLRKNSHEVLQLPEVIARKKKIKFIICLDEFQNLSYFRNSLVFEKKLRANWQRQEYVTYCLYGSKRHMMTEIFNSSSKPFYRFGDIMMLQKISEEKWVEFITDGFAKTGKNIDPQTAALIPRLMRNHSWYVQQLSHYTWNLTHKKAGNIEIHTALKELLNANSPLYQRDAEILSITQLNLLKAITSGEKRLTGVSVMSEYALGTPRNVSKNKTTLLNHDIIHLVDDAYEFLDPAFEIWFKKTFLNQEPSVAEE
jgi:hypothetical protein